MTSTLESTQVYEKTTLDNGLRVVSCDMPHTRSVSISIFVGVGSRYEPDEWAGMSHFVEHMVFKGTESRPDPVQISAQIEGVGGVLNAGTEHEVTAFWCKVAQPHFGDSLELLFDMLRNSLYRSDDIENERHIIHEELAMIHDYPTSRVDSLIDEMLWPGHPLGRDIGGTAESIDRITREALLEHMARHYAPSNIVVSVAGSVPHSEVVSQAWELSRDWTGDSTSDDPTPVTHMQGESQFRLEYRSTEQLHLSIALPGLGLDDPDAHSLDLPERNSRRGNEQQAVRRAEGEARAGLRRSERRLPLQGYRRLRHNRRRRPFEHLRGGPGNLGAGGRREGLRYRGRDRESQAACGR